MNLKSTIQALSLREKKRLQIWLTTLIAEEEGQTREIQVGQVTYRQEWVRCGKEQCRCAGGELHGPYWYRYWREGGRYRSAYVGKKGPVEMEAGRGECP